MTDIPPGAYGIANRVLSSDNNSLAVNSNGNGQTLTVNNNDAGSTTWSVGPPDQNGMHTISDADDPTLYVGLDDNNNLVTAPFDPPPTWSIRMIYGVYTIQDSAFNGFWVLQNPAPTQNVGYGVGTGTSAENWVFINTA